MKSARTNLRTTLGGLTALALSMLTISAWAMPPSPDLLNRMANGNASRSYYFEHEAEIRALGVESPRKIALLTDLAGRHLDENFNILAILVDFSDHVSTAQATSFDNLLYGTGTGTVRNYYDQVTYGNVTLVTVNLPSDLGWRRMPHTYAYYVNGQQGFGSYPQNAQKLAEDAVSAVSGQVNFANYDNDGDGYVDALFVIHSGTGAELSGSNYDIWSHKWSMATPLHFNGKTISSYSMEPEFWYGAGDMTCGVYCHELGHDAFGLPDLYDTGYDSQGIGNWSLMAGGSWNGSLGSSPAHPDAWCRIQMGALSPINLTANQYGASLPSVESSGTIFRLWTNGAAGNQYFLVENRQRTGYDVALPASGLLIWHIDDSQTSNDNQWYPGHTSSGHYHVALIQADNLWQLEQYVNRGNSSDPYPGNTGNTVFDDASSPNSRSYSGTPTSVAVRNISASAASMTADLIVTSSPPPSSLTVTSPDGGESWLSSESRTITWSSQNLTGNVLIELNRAYPSSAWEVLTSGTANTGFYIWTVAGIASSSARIRIRGVTQTAVGDTSNANFSLTVPPVAPILVANCDPSGNVRLDWNSTGSAYYKLYSAATSEGPFTNLIATTADTTYVDSTSGDLKFYTVTSSTTP